MSAAPPRRHRRHTAVTATRRGPSTAVIAAVVVLVLFAGGIGFGLYRAQRADAVVAPAGATASGVTIGQPSAPATVDIYLDFQCPVCKAYEQQVGPALDRMVAAGQAKVVYHPAAFLDRYSSTHYSTRSSQASACAADAGVFPQYAQALFTNQPPENAAGLPDSQLISLGRQAGAGDDFATCVQSGRYAGWTASVTDAASKAGVSATPTVLVNGTAISRTLAALVAAVSATQG